MITLYLGLMGSGKTEHLLKDYLFCNYNKLLVSSSYTRNNGFVSSRCGLKYPCDLQLHSNQSIYIEKAIKEKGYEYIFIDEFQFFDIDILDLIDKYIHLNWYLSGLERDVYKNNFGYINYIRRKYLCNINYYDMNCQNCNKRKAEEMTRTVNNDNVILVGDKEYLSVCDECYEVINEKITKANKSIKQIKK